MAEIMELLQQRDERALELLKETYGKYCYSIIYGLLRSHEETADYFIGWHPDGRRYISKQDYYNKNYDAAF